MRKLLVPNPFLTDVFGQLRYLAPRPDATSTMEWVRLERSPALEVVLDAASAGTSSGQLLAALGAWDPELDDQERTSYLRTLQDEGVLVPASVTAKVLDREGAADADPDRATHAGSAFGVELHERLARAAVVLERFGARTERQRRLETFLAAFREHYGVALIPWVEATSVLAHREREMPAEEGQPLAAWILAACVGAEGRLPPDVSLPVHRLDDVVGSERDVEGGIRARWRPLGGGPEEPLGLLTQVQGLTGFQLAAQRLTDAWMLSAELPGEWVVYFFREGTPPSRESLHYTLNRRAGLVCPDRRRVPISDLLLENDGTSFWLRSNSFGVRLHAVIPGGRAQPPETDLFRLLHAFCRGWPGPELGWDWGSTRVDHLPRICCDRIVLSPAAWRIPQQNLDPEVVQEAFASTAGSPGSGFTELYLDRLASSPASSPAPAPAVARPVPNHGFDAVQPWAYDAPGRIDVAFAGSDCGSSSVPGPFRFIESLRDACRQRGLVFRHCDTRAKLYRLLRGLQQDTAELGIVVNYLFSDRRFSDLRRAFLLTAKDSGGRIINDMDRGPKINKANLTYELLAHGIEVPRTLIWRPWEPARDLSDEERAYLGDRIVCKPSRGGGGRGIAFDFEGTKQRFEEVRAESPSDEYLLQEYVEPIWIDGYPACFRFYYCLGEIHGFFDPPPRIGRPGTPVDHRAVGGAQLETFGLGEIIGLVRKVAEISKYDWFSCEIWAARRHGRIALLPIDFVNDHCYARAVSEVGPKGVPDEIIDACAGRIVEVAAELKSQPRPKVSLRGSDA